MNPRSRLLALLLPLLVLGAQPVAADSAPSPATSGAMPDVVGLRPGIAPQEAYNFLKAYDRSAAVYVSDTSLPPAGAKPTPVAIAMAQDPSAAEKIQADLTLPPMRQIVWRVARHLQFAEGKQTTIPNVIASLRAKYGPEAWMPSGRVIALTWYFDEQGHRTNLPAGTHPGTCAGRIGPTVPMWGIPAGHGAPYPLIQPLPVSEQEEICRAVVVVQAIATQGIDQRLVGVLDVVIADLALEARAHRATVQMLANAAAGQQQKELDRANQQEGPKL